MRTLAFDYGMARIGVAVSDPMGMIATPHSTIEAVNQGEQTREAARLVEELEAQRLVVGLPIEMSGAAGEMAERASRFATKMAQLTGLPVFTWDERLTSVAAERAILEVRGGGGKGGRGRGKARAPGKGKAKHKGKGEVDRVAASLILQAFLDGGGVGAMAVEPAGEAPQPPPGAGDSEARAD